jgi:uncharacterized repeat protein (TIGR04138 family)
MTFINDKLLEVTRRDARYTYEAYEFVFQALEYTQKSLGRALDPTAEPSEAQHHVSGRQLVEGIRDYALQEFGLMARVVFRLWGIQQTADFGEIVFNLIEAELMSRTNEDTRADFRDVFDLDEALLGGFRLVLEEEA